MNVSKTQLRYFALITALLVAGIGVTTLVSQRFSTLVSHGPIQQGHENIECIDCHTPGVGNIRQQVQANLSFALGNRAKGVDFGYQPVTSFQCLACHDRPNDRHPIYRFNEPRFASVRQQLNANSCLGCHSEHDDSRVSVTETICSHCHDELVLKNDPLDVHHVQLVADDAWGTCLGCHDFHGNYPHTPQTLVSNAFSIDAIQDYLKNGVIPYGGPKLYEVKSND